MNKRIRIIIGGLLCLAIFSIYTLWREHAWKESYKQMVSARMNHNSRRYLFYANKALYLAKMFPSNSSDEIKTMNSLGNYYIDMKQYGIAKDFLLEAHQLCYRYIGYHSFDMGLSCMNIGVLYTNMGRYHEAEIMFDESRNIISATDGYHSKTFITIIQNSACLYEREGKLIEAEKLYKRTVELAAQAPNINSGDIINWNILLADYYCRHDKYALAEKILLATKKKLEAADNDDIQQRINLYESLGYLYVDRGNYMLAKQYFGRAIELAENLLGKSNYYTIHILSDIAQVEELCGHADDAAILDKHILVEYQSMSGEERNDCKDIYMSSMKRLAVYTKNTE